ncbi:MAG: exo-alpha-sialidase, partial [Thermomicrobiales bacterium]|nr:exo-alpha-sialidase [Thermomicrobiales bacterium]
PGGDVQFGPAAVVDGAGIVHVVYSASSAGDPANSATLMYARISADGEISDPVSVAPDANAGYQMMPAIAADPDGGVHLIWRDQRLVSSEARAEHPANANLFVSDLVDGTWTAPVQLTEPDTADGAGTADAWPHLALQKDRLVAVWSIYSGATDEAMKSASRIEWATRPLDNPTGWSEPVMLLEQTDGEIGGRLIDVAGNADGQIAAVYGAFARTTNALMLRRLDPGAADWSPEIALSGGDFGYMPSIAVAPDGKLFIAFNAGRNKNVEVGGMAVPAGADKPIGPVSLTPAEDGLQARAVVAVTASGVPWIVYMHQPIGSNTATEIRTLRGFDVGQSETGAGG